MSDVIRLSPKYSEFVETTGGIYRIIAKCDINDDGDLHVLKIQELLTLSSFSSIKLFFVVKIF